jgi:hypothetical protein
MRCSVKPVAVFFIITALSSLAQYAVSKHKKPDAFQDCRQVAQQATIKGKKEIIIVSECNDNGTWKTRFVTDGNGNPLPSEVAADVPVPAQNASAKERLTATTPQTSFTASQPIYVPQE